LAHSLNSCFSRDACSCSAASIDGPTVVCQQPGDVGTSKLFFGVAFFLARPVRASFTPAPSLAQPAQLPSDQGVAPRPCGIGGMKSLSLRNVSHPGSPCGPPLKLASFFSRRLCRSPTSEALFLDANGWPTASGSIIGISRPKRRRLRRRVTREHVEIPQGFASNSLAMTEAKTTADRPLDQQRTRRRRIEAH
jgi:hypothetical protein